MRAENIIRVEMARAEAQKLLQDLDELIEDTSPTSHPELREVLMLAEALGAALKEAEA